MAIITPAVIAIGTAVVATGVGTARGILANKAIDDLIDELDELQEDLGERIVETEDERDRRIKKAWDDYAEDLEALRVEIDKLKGEEHERYKLALEGPGGLQDQITALEAAMILSFEKYEADIRWLDEEQLGDETEQERLKTELKNRLDDTIKILEQRLVDLFDGKEVALKEIIRQQDQLDYRKKHKLDQLIQKAAEGDAEAIRKTAQIVKTRDEMLKNVKDSAIIQMNEIGAKGKYSLGKQVDESELEIARKKATSAALGFRRAGTPLMSLNHIIKRMNEAEERKKGEIKAHLSGMATETGARLGQLKSQAEMNIDDIFAANALFSFDLDRQADDIELAYTEESANLAFTKSEIESGYLQDKYYLEAEIITTRMTYGQDLADLLQTDLDIIAHYDHARDLVAKEYAKTELAEETEMGQLEGAVETLELGYAQAMESIRRGGHEEGRKLLQAVEGTEEDLTAAASLVTSEYQRRMDTGIRKKEQLQGSRAAIVIEAIASGVSGTIQATSSFLTSARNIVDVDWGGK